MNLDNFTSEQIGQMIANLAAELARRASAPPAAKPQDPMHGLLLSLAQPPSAQQQAQPPHPHFVPERTEPVGEPRARKAFAAGANGRDGSPPDSLVAGPSMEMLSRQPASRGFPPGAVYATSRTDPALARAFGILPQRTDEAVIAGAAPPMQGAGQGQGAVDLEPTVSR